MTAAVTVVPAPPCPAWCTETHPVDGWDEVGRNTTKMCQRRIVEDEGMCAYVTVQRFADIDHGRIEVEPAVVRVDVSEAFTPAEARELARSLIEAAVLAEDPRRLGSSGSQ